MDARTLEVFQRRAIKSKEELLEAVSHYISRLRAMRDSDFSLPCDKAAVISIVSRFKELIQQSDLAYLDRPFEGYEIMITNTGISLVSAEYERIKLGIDNEFEETNSSVSPDILSIGASYVTAEEFAHRHQTDISTVMNWIKHREIKCAKRLASGWHILETQKPPSGEPEFGSYIFIEADGDLSLIAPLKGNPISLTLLPPLEGGGAFEIATYSQKGYCIEHREVGTEELAAIEAALIESDEVEFEFELIDMVDEKVVQGFDLNPFAHIPKKHLLRFIDQSEIPEDSKKTLSALALSNCGEALFVSTIRKLSLGESFTNFAGHYFDDPDPLLS